MPARVKNDDLAFDLVIGQGIEFGEVVHEDYGRGDAAGRRSDAHAEPKHVQRLLDRCKQFSGFCAAYPMGHHHRLNLHVLQTGLAHKVRAPGYGGVERNAAA